MKPASSGCIFNIEWGRRLIVVTLCTLDLSITSVLFVVTNYSQQLKEVNKITKTFSKFISLDPAAWMACRNGNGRYSDSFTAYF